MEGKITHLLYWSERHKEASACLIEKGFTVTQRELVQFRAIYHAKPEYVLVTEGASQQLVKAWIIEPLEGVSFRVSTPYHLENEE